MSARMKLVLGILSACIALPANATLIGDEIQIAWENENGVINLCGAPQVATTTVAVGDGDEVGFGHCFNNGSPFTVSDADGAGFDVAFKMFSEFTSRLFNGLTFRDLDWMPAPSAISGLSISTNLSGWTNDRAAFGADWVTLNFQGLRFHSENWLRVDLQASHVSVPEPTTLGLFGLGLVGAGLARRRRRS